MDDFKKENIIKATAWDYNCPRYVKRTKGDGKKLRRYSRRKLRMKDKSFIIKEEKEWLKKENKYENCNK